MNSYALDANADVWRNAAPGLCSRDALSHNGIDLVTMMKCMVQVTDPVGY